MKHLTFNYTLIFMICQQKNERCQMTGCRLGRPEPEHGEGQVLAALRLAQVILLFLLCFHLEVTLNERV